MNTLNPLQKKSSKQNLFNQAYFASKSTLLTWASNLLQLNITSFEELQTGAIFCQLLDACHPGSVNLHRVKWKANSETDYINNFILFQQGLKENNIEKPIDINLLSKGKQNALNELLQWMYGYYLNSPNNYFYDAFNKRGKQDFIFNNKKKEINNKYHHQQRKKNNNRNALSKDKDNLTQISTTSNNSLIKSVNSDYDNNLRNYRNNNFNVSNLRQNLRNNNYNFNDNINESRYRNKSKQETRNKKYYEYENNILRNNNNNKYVNNNNINNDSNNFNNYNNYTQNKKNFNEINNNNNNYYYTQNRQNIQNQTQKRYNNYTSINRYQSTPIINTPNNDEINTQSRRNFPNIFEKNQEYLLKQINNISPFDEQDCDSQNYNDINIDELEPENNELDITDLFGLNEEETKKVFEEEKKDGNRIKDLKNIIRKLRINIISKEKELNNLKGNISHEYKLKNFYLNKLKDIEYLYFNPVIQNTNENKNNILRQLLCSNEDCYIILDQNNYAYLKSVNPSINQSKSKIINNNININNNDNINYMNNVKMNNNNNNINNNVNLSNNNNISVNVDNNMNLKNHANINMDLDIKKRENNESSIKQLNYSSRKNYNANYMDNLFDSFNNNKNINTDINNNENINININNNIVNHNKERKNIPIKIICGNKSQLTNVTSNKSFISNNNYENKISQNNENDENNNNINYQKKYLIYSEKKKENVNNNNYESELNKKSMKTEFKSKNSIYADISSQLLNESLHIPNI